MTRTDQLQERSLRLPVLHGVTALLLLGSLLTVLGTPSALARSLEEIEASGELRVCFSPIHPSIVSAEPPGCREDCAFTGPAFEAAQAFAASLGGGVRVRGLAVPWNEQFANAGGEVVYDGEYVPELLASGTCDLYPNNLAKTPWRLKKLDIVTMFPNRLIVLTGPDRKDSLRGPSDLAGKVAAVEKETSFHSWLLEQNRSVFSGNPIEIRLLPTDQAFQAILAGEADFTVIDADAAFWAIRRQYDALHMAFPVGATDEVGWAMRKEDQELQQAVATFFTAQRAYDGSALNQLWNDYFGMNLQQFIGLLGSIQE